MNNRPGCLVGLFKLFLLDVVFDWLQRRFGFGRGCSCSGIGCGIILFIIFVALACSTLTGTDWTRLF
jgi:predicted PurR-regulated permease PerM